MRAGGRSAGNGTSPDYSADISKYWRDDLKGVLMAPEKTGPPGTGEHLLLWVDPRAGIAGAAIRDNGGAWLLRFYDGAVHDGPGVLDLTEETDPDVLAQWVAGQLGYPVILTRMSGPRWWLPYGLGERGETAAYRVTPALDLEHHAAAARADIPGIRRRVPDDDAGLADVLAARGRAEDIRGECGPWPAAAAGQEGDDRGGRL